MPDFFKTRNMNRLKHFNSYAIRKRCDLLFCFCTFHGEPTAPWRKKRASQRNKVGERSKSPARNHVPFTLEFFHPRVSCTQVFQAQLNRCLIYECHFLPYSINARDFQIRAKNSYRHRWQPASAADIENIFSIRRYTPQPWHQRS